MLMKSHADDPSRDQDCDARGLIPAGLSGASPGHSQADMGKLCASLPPPRRAGGADVPQRVNPLQRRSAQVPHRGSDSRYAKEIHNRDRHPRLLPRFVRIDRSARTSAVAGNSSRWKMRASRQLTSSIPAVRSRDRRTSPAGPLLLTERFIWLPAAVGEHMRPCQLSAGVVITYLAQEIAMEKGLPVPSLCHRSGRFAGQQLCREAATGVGKGPAASSVLLAIWRKHGPQARYQLADLNPSTAPPHVRFRCDARHRSLTTVAVIVADRPDEGVAPPVLPATFELLSGTTNHARTNASSTPADCPLGGDEDDTSPIAIGKKPQRGPRLTFSRTKKSMQTQTTEPSAARSDSRPARRLTSSKRHPGEGCVTGPQ